MGRTVGNRAQAGLNVLVIHPIPYLLEFGGLCIASRAMSEELAKLGASVTVLTCDAPNTLAGDLLREEERVRVVQHGGVEVHALRGVDVGSPDSMRQIFLDLIHSLEPDLFVVAEDVAVAPGRPPEFGLWTKLLTDVVDPQRVVYCCHSAAALPFGPQATTIVEDRRQRFGQLGGIATVSGHLRDYVAAHVKAPVSVVRFPVYGKGFFPDLGSFDRKIVGIINPSIIKGHTIFAAVARSLPDVRFAAVPTWASTPANLDELRSIGNVAILEPTHDRDELYSRFSILLVPSLWLEAFGLVVVEAMLRGIPVVAADQGGLPEAKLGVPYLLPVQTFPRMENSLETLTPPPQNVGPWVEVTRRLISDRAEYERISRWGREASLKFVEEVSAKPFLTLLEFVCRTSGGGART